MDISIRTLETRNYAAVKDLISNELGYSNLNKEDTFKRLDAIRKHKDYQTLVAVYNNTVSGIERKKP